MEANPLGAWPPRGRVIHAGFVDAFFVALVIAAIPHDF